VKELWEQTGTARFPEDALSLTLAATPYSIHLCRGLWLLLDTIEWLSRPAGLWASLAVGMIVATVAFAVVNRASCK